MSDTHAQSTRPAVTAAPSARTAQRASGERVALIAAWLAFALGVAYAAVSIYWGLGGTALLGTLGGALERAARSGSASSLLLVWGAAVLKLVAALLVVETIRAGGRLAHRPWARVLCWIEAAILTLYGLVQTVAGLLIQAGAVSASRHADHRALVWHAYLWDPWFLAWGLLVLVAMLASRRHAASR